MSTGKEIRVQIETNIFMLIFIVRNQDNSVGKGILLKDECLNCKTSACKQMNLRYCISHPIEMKTECIIHINVRFPCSKTSVKKCQRIYCTGLHKHFLGFKNQKL